MKKLLSLTLSLLMAFSMCLTVSAEDISSGEALESYLNQKIEEYKKISEGDFFPSVIIDLRDNVTIENLTAEYFDITVNLNGNTLNIDDSIYVKNGKKITINDYKGGGAVNIAENIDAYSGTFEVTGGTYNINVADFLGFSCSIVETIDEKYTVYDTQYAQSTAPVVKEGAVATLNGTASSTLSGLSSIAKVNKTGETTDNYTIPNGAEVRYALTSDCTFVPEGWNEKVANELKEKIDNLDETNLAKATNLSFIPLDINLTVRITIDTTVEDYEVRNVGTKIPVTLYLSELDAANLKAAKYVGVIRIHSDNETSDTFTLIENNSENPNAVVFNPENNTLTFDSDRFSTYYIAYSTSSSSGSGSGSSTTTTPTKTYDPKDKNQDGVITCDEEMNSANWVWSDSKGACVYSVTNTSVR